MKKIMTSIFVFFIILLLSISIIMANNVVNKTNFEINQEKIYYEIRYFDSKIIYMANMLNNVEEEINWENLQKQTSSLYNYWNSVILDLNYLNIDKIYLTDFGKNLDQLSVSFENKDKIEALTSLIKLYNKLIIYSECLDYAHYKNIILTKYNLLLANLNIEIGNWTLAHEYILTASEKIYEVVKYSENEKYNQYNVNQSYVAVKELENLIYIKNVEVFYTKYKIALDKLENL